MSAFPHTAREFQYSPEYNALNLVEMYLNFQIP